VSRTLRLRTRLTAPARWLRRAYRIDGTERQSVVQAAKTALAVSAAWLVSGFVWHAPQSFAAPYAAVFLVNDTVYRSVATAFQQTLGLVLGIVLGYLAIRAIPQPYAALAVTVFVATLMGRWRRLGSSGDWVAVTALLMLTYGTAGNDTYLVERVVQSLIGAVIGVAVNLLVLPPTHLRSAHSAVSDQIGRAHELICSLAEGLRAEWSEDDARAWLAKADGLRRDLAGVERAIGRGAESMRFNLWRVLVLRRRVLGPPTAHQPIVSALSQVAQQCQRIGELLLSGFGEEGEPNRPDPAFTDALADLLTELAEIVAAYGTRGTWSETTGDRLRTIIADLRERHRGLTADVRHGQLPRPDSWSMQGGLLFAVERALLAVLAATDQRWPRPGMSTPPAGWRRWSGLARS
jgi:uncharacterized membrane protein YccC